jgi:murein DD-endopeptidase MepM/ murein hydrolase activator NlpD
VSYRAPVLASIVVVRPFEAPPGPYAAGHRGVDLATSPDDVVLAAGSGRVRFAGSVAGRGVVVIEHPDGVLTEYEPVRPTVSAGEPLSRGQPIGRVQGSHGGCSPSRCLHWGARRDGAYFDPMTLLVGLGPVRLLPWD